jgi:hypothetical protein
MRASRLFKNETQQNVVGWRRRKGGKLGDDFGKCDATVAG